MHSIGGLTELLRQTLDPPSDFWQLASSRPLDDATRAVEVTKRQAIPNRLLGVTLIVLHDVAQFDNLQCLLLVVNAQVNGEQVQGLIIKFGEKLTWFAAAVLFLGCVDVLVARDATFETGLIFDEVVAVAL